MTDALPTEQRLTMGNNAAFPTLDSTPEGGLQLREWGLTRRELFAAMAMQGFLASLAGESPYADVAADAVGYADALLAELEKPRG